jgi:phage terminase large subunit
MAAAEANDRVALVSYNPKYPVETWWDIGFRDDTSIVFAQRMPTGMIHIIDFYSNNTQSFAHYAEVLEKKGYRYSRHILPHDTRHHEIGSGLTKKETLENLGVRPIKIAQHVERQQGIENVRMMLPICVFDEKKTDALRVHLKNYRRSPSRHGGFSDSPLHDQHSHAADAVRYGACAPKILEGQAQPLNIRNFGAV